MKHKTTIGHILTGIFHKSQTRLMRTLRHNLGINVTRWTFARNFRRDRIWYQEQYIDFKIQQNAIVLDLGSGPTPFPYANILLERYLDETVHRHGNVVRDSSKPLVQGDICHLPFKDKSIDFVYCAHVLEHLDDPQLACKELMRVAKKGYIETPNFMKDTLFCWAEIMHHRWHTVSKGKQLYFFEYSTNEQKGIRSSAWSDIIFGEEYHPLQDAFIDHQNLFHTMFYWEDEFDVFIVKDTTK